jgi:hypothetical protein
MRARFGKALEVIFQFGPNADQMPPFSPGADQFFDFEDGMRICVTRDGFGETLERHVSVSFLPDTQLWRECKSRDNFGFVSKMMFKLLAEDRYRAISGDDKPFQFHGFSKTAGVPHWRRPE